MAEALYRKYRPQIFEDVVGQEHIERTLKNAIASDKVSHAYLFTGPRGTGKTTTARLLSKALLCEKGPTPDPDGTCEDCELIAVGEHPDVYELDAASRTGVENVREEIIGRVGYAPTRGRYKVYIIDEVHMLSTAAFNALLKTLEEPPSHVVFILCTTDPQKVPETIHSRCQRFDFRRIASEELIARLGAICEMEGIEYEGDALDLIAHRAQGGMRDALTSLEQLIAFGDGKVTTQLAERLLGSLDSSDLADIVKAIGTRDAAACFRWTSEYMETGADLAQFAQELASHIRDMYVMSLTDADVALEVTEAGRRELEVELQWYGSDRLARMLAVLDDLIAELKTSTNQRLSFEIALTRMIRPESDLTLSALAERIEELERMLASGIPATTIAPMAASATTQRTTPSTPAQSQDPESAQMRSRSSEDPTVPEPEREPEAADPAPAVAEVPESSVTVEGSSSTPQTAAAIDVGSINVPQFWNTTLAHLKKAAAAYGVLFMNTAPSLDAEEGKLIIAFEPTNDFAFQAVQKPEVREALANALARAGAPGIAYEIVKGESGVTAKAAGDVSATVPASIVESSQTVPVAAQESPVETAPQAASVPEPEPMPSAPLEDEVPLSAYEDMAPADVASAPDVAPFPEEPTPSVPEDSTDDLNDILFSTFGTDVKIEEV